MINSLAPKLICRRSVSLYVSKNQKVVITGASGFVGRSVGQFLARNGFEIVSLVRKEPKKTIGFGKVVLIKDFTENHLVSPVQDSLSLLHFI